MGKDVGRVRRDGRGGGAVCVVRVPLRNLRMLVVHVKSLVAFVDGTKCVHGVSGRWTAPSGSCRALLLS